MNKVNFNEISKDIDENPDDYACIRTITGNALLYAVDLAIDDLEAMLLPYGSLDHDRRKIAEAMVEYAAVPVTDRDGKAELGRRLVDLVWGAQCDEISAVHLDMLSVTLITPTSGTMIWSKRTADGIVYGCFFGDSGSKMRATVVLEAAERPERFSVEIV